ncbi:uncharacterized protein LOC113849925 [Abrus precatorius]|uniref:Uncharacterized protein LOC113849925 n=1 Tax=Abrus precatorius TaxID=3816 RepID=A0A8B8JWT6_ABRPR|nr:uncharacterized protein LOC113849925 [Abrus precatorius]
MNSSGYEYDQPQPSSVYPPRLPIAPEPPNSAQPSQTHKLNPVQGPPVPGSVKPAAAAAVAGALPQLVGSVDGVRREPIGLSQYRGRGRRGGRQFRGVGRGRVNHPHGRGLNHPRGRGRGRGGNGRQFPSHSSEPSISNKADTAGAAGATSVVQPSSVPRKSPLTNPAQIPTASLQVPPCKLWCEICKAECNTPEMLEQHKNGKRHRKNLLVHEELQRLRAINGQQGESISNSRSNLTIQPEKVHNAEATADNHKAETEVWNNVGGKSDVQSEELQEEPGEKAVVLGHGFKRKMRGERGGKYMRSNDGSRKPRELPKPRQVTSFICELCNVKCESQVVYNSHLTGKKHLSNFKRVHGHQTLNGEAGIQPPQPSDINALTNSNNFPVQQGIGDPQVLLAQLLMTVLSRVPVLATAPPAGPVAAQLQVPPSVAGSSHEPLSQNLTQTQVSDSLPHFESENPTGETKNQMSSSSL